MRMPARQTAGIVTWYLTKVWFGIGMYSIHASIILQDSSATGPDVHLVFIFTTEDELGATFSATSVTDEGLGSDAWVRNTTIVQCCTWRGILIVIGQYLCGIHWTCM